MTLSSEEPPASPAPAATTSMPRSDVSVTPATTTTSQTSQAPVYRVHIVDSPVPNLVGALVAAIIGSLITAAVIRQQTQAASTAA